jgi:hypothetical protein
MILRTRLIRNTNGVAGLSTFYNIAGADYKKYHDIPNFKSINFCLVRRFANMSDKIIKASEKVAKASAEKAAEVFGDSKLPNNLKKFGDLNTTELKKEAPFRRKARNLEILNVKKIKYGDGFVTKKPDSKISKYFLPSAEVANACTTLTFIGVTVFGLKVVVKEIELFYFKVDLCFSGLDGKLIEINKKASHMVNITDVDRFRLVVAEEKSDADILLAELRMFKFINIDLAEMSSNFEVSAVNLERRTRLSNYIARLVFDVDTSITFRSLKTKFYLSAELKIISDSLISSEEIQEFQKKKSLDAHSAFLD